MAHDALELYRQRATVLVARASEIENYETNFVGATESAKGAFVQTTFEPHRYSIRHRACSDRFRD